MSSIKPENVRYLLETYGRIVKGMTELDSLKEKDLKRYHEVKNTVLSLLGRFKIDFPLIYESLEQNPIQFKPSELELKLNNLKVL